MELVLLGFGQIGRSLAAMVGRVRRPALDLKVAAVIDRSGFVFDPQGLGPRRLASLAAEKRKGRRLADAPRGRAANAEEAIRYIAGYALTRPVLLDLTADDTAPALEQALVHGMDLVLANKRPLAGRRSVSESLWQTARARGRRVLHEATVGAGLPVISTLRDLRETGDKLSSVEGIFSGTLAYLFNVYDGKKPFSDIVKDAKAKGYTEPDPRDDLSGTDFTRKVIILGREMGLKIEMKDVQVESLIPPGLEKGTPDEFLAKLPQFDGDMKKRFDAAAAKGKVLRYMGRLTADGKATVGVAELDRTHAFANIALTDNVVRYATQRYNTNPLIVQGPGAGPEVTAAGVFADLLRVCSYLGAHL
jgi:aspartokinase/homoserine dehydrogenase 1